RGARFGRSAASLGEASLLAVSVLLLRGREPVGDGVGQRLDGDAVGQLDEDPGLAGLRYLDVGDAAEEAAGGEDFVSGFQLAYLLLVARLFLLDGAEEHEVEGDDHAHEHGRDQSAVAHATPALSVPALAHPARSVRANLTASSSVPISPAAAASSMADRRRPTSGPGPMPSSRMSVSPETKWRICWPQAPTAPAFSAWARPRART